VRPLSSLFRSPFALEAVDLAQVSFRMVDMPNGNTLFDKSHGQSHQRSVRICLGAVLFRFGSER